MYKLGNDIFTKKPAFVRRMSDGVMIPFDETNTDYQEYLKWVAEGNTPQPADKE